MYSETMASQFYVSSNIKGRLPIHCYLNLEDDDERTLELIKEVENTYFSKGGIRASQPDSDGSSEDETNFITWSDVDISLYADLANFEQNGCGCKHLYGKPCCEVVGFENIKSTRLSSAELTKDGMDLIVLAHLNQNRDSSLQTKMTGSRTRVKDRKRSSMKYFLCGEEICKATYMFAYGISVKRLKNLCKHFDDHGIMPRKHGNKGKTIHNAATMVIDEHVLTFVRSYTSIHGLQLPGKMPKMTDYTVMMLPNDQSKSSVWREYVIRCTETGINAVGISKFKVLWKRFMPDITVMKTSADLCDTCQINNKMIMKSVNLDENDKSDCLQQQENHLHMASECRIYYKQLCEAARDYWSSLSLPEKRGDLEGPLHISFGYGQDLTYPYSPLQVGPMYFKQPRKCSVFGICTEHNPKQVNYMTDEADLTGKGVNETISYLHHYLMYHINKTKSLQFHCNNSSENKDNCLMQYMCWRVLSGQNDNIEVSFMMPYHSRFGPDWCFGLVKLKYRRSFVSSMIQIANVVLSSTTKNINQPQMIRDPATNDIVVISYNWRNFFTGLFNLIPDINKYNHFRFSREYPGYVFVREYPSMPEICVKMMKDGKVVPPRHSVPSVIQPPGLSLERSWYLFDNVRRHCDEQYADISFPEPDEPRPSSAIAYHI